MSDITKLSPKAIWKYFDEITKVPRPSKKEDKIIAYLEDFAARHSLPVKKDQAGNIVITRPAIGKGVGRPAVILQSHMDMVCEKNSDKVFDFDNDPITTVVTDDGWLKAEGTTLGADDGIGMAASLALLADKKLELPQIEALFTVDEETGLTGANRLSGDMLTGKLLINLDSEDEEEILIGCAGGIDTYGTFRYKKESVPEGSVFFRVDVSGLKGGHSGDKINAGQANSNKILNRFLWTGEREFGLRLNIFDGGNMRNAIPREAYAVFCVPKNMVTKMFGVFETYSRDVRNEFAVIEDEMDITISEQPIPEYVIDTLSQNKLLNTVQGMPNGVFEMSAAIPGLVETSSNLASVKFKGDDTIEVVTSQRSSVESAKFNASRTIRSVFELAGAEVINSDGYPGWAPDPSSDLLKIAELSYRKLFGTDPVVKAVHAGLECGLFLRKFPQLEMISIGPTIRDPHSPEEKINIASVGKFWEWLIDILQRI